MSMEVFKDKSGNTFNMQIIDGRWLSTIVPVDVYTNIPNVPIRHDDAIVCGYMRSGTHWTYEMTHMLLKGKAETVPKWKGAEQFELTSQEELDKLSSPRVLNTHMLFRDLPRGVATARPKFIFLLRDPRDVAVSNYNVLMDIPEKSEYNGSFDDFLDLFIHGRVMYGSWFDYVLHWEDVIDIGKADVLVLHYEDTHKDVLNTVHKLSDFLGLSRNDSLCEQIVEKCQFQRMKQDKKNYTFIPESGKNMIYRKGIVGDWRNWFTVAQSEMFDTFLKEKMGNCKLAKRYLPN